MKLRADYWAMFTGDAGEQALASALDSMNPEFDLSNFKFVQIPHHGSENNVSSAVLDRWLGPVQLYDVQTRTAYVSSAAKSIKHPSHKVMNAFRRRGAYPFATEGQALWHCSNAPRREGYNTLTPYPFHEGAA